MTELENQEVETVETDVDTETTSNNEVELTTDDYYKEKSSREKAENNWVKPTKQILKKYWFKNLDELDAKLGSRPAEVEDLVNSTLKERDFYSNNPDLVDFKDEIKAYQSKGLSLEEAKTLLMNSDKVLEARQKLNKIKPSTVGQAGRISGINPSDISILILNLRKNSKWSI